MPKIEVNGVKRYDILYVDPPWTYETDGAPAAKRPCLERGEKPHSVKHYYETMSTQDIINFPINDFAKKDCVCFLWVTNPLLPEGFKTLEKWGFKYCQT